VVEGTLRCMVDACACRLPVFSRAFDGDILVMSYVFICDSPTRNMYSAKAYTLPPFWCHEKHRRPLGLSFGFPVN
jgi:hypothetical protein